MENPLFAYRPYWYLVNDKGEYATIVNGADPRVSWTKSKAMSYSFKTMEEAQDWGFKHIDPDAGVAFQAVCPPRV